MTVKDLYLVLPENQIVFIDDNANEIDIYSGMADDIPLDLFNKYVVEVKTLGNGTIFISCE